MNGKYPRASYVLDLSPLDSDFVGGTFSGTARGEKQKAIQKERLEEGKKIFKERRERVKACKDPAFLANYKAQHKGVGVHPDSHYHPLLGLLCLKEAIRLITTNYPELLAKVYFYNSPFWFKPIFTIFSLWIPKDTRKKLVFCKKGEWKKMETIDESNLSSDWGGKGLSNDHDDFIGRAIQKYDNEIKSLTYAVVKF